MLPNNQHLDYQHQVSTPIGKNGIKGHLLMMYVTENSTANLLYRLRQCLLITIVQRVSVRNNFKEHLVGNGLIQLV